MSACAHWRPTQRICSSLSEGEFREFALTQLCVAGTEHVLCDLQAWLTVTEVVSQHDTEHPPHHLCCMLGNVANLLGNIPRVTQWVTLHTQPNSHQRMSTSSTSQPPIRKYQNTNTHTLTQTRRSTHRPHFNFKGSEVESTCEGVMASTQWIAKCAMRPENEPTPLIKYCSG
jgi:hypothetical protein